MVESTDAADGVYNENELFVFAVLASRQESPLQVCNAMAPNALYLNLQPRGIPCAIMLQVSHRPPTWAFHHLKYHHASAPTS